jgi:hypothetical protein
MCGKVLKSTEAKNPSNFLRAEKVLTGLTALKEAIFFLLSHCIVLSTTWFKD